MPRCSLGRVKRVLVIDIGGSNVKIRATGCGRTVRIPSGPRMTPRALVSAVLKASKQWRYDCVSIGYPGLVVAGRPREDNPNLGRGWTRFDFRGAFRRPVRLINDAAMQALGSYRGGRMLFLGLGTGLGSTLILDGLVHPLELGDLPFRQNRSFADYLGKGGRRRLGRPRWTRHALAGVRLLKTAMQVDYIVLGGGGAKYIGKPPAGVVLGDNFKAFLGGQRLWQKNYTHLVVQTAVHRKSPA